MSDFEDDEDFGLDSTVGGKPANTDKAEAIVEDEEDIYGDIAGQSTNYPLVPVSNAKAQSSGPSHQEDQRLALVERQNSGAQAESRLTADASKPVVTSTKPLPKKLADTKVVYVGELEWWTTDADIETIVSEFGPLESVNFFEEKGSGKSKGYCLVKFDTKEAANICRHEMNGMEINGRKCVVTFSYKSNPSTKATRQQPVANVSQPSRGQAYNGRVQQFGSGGAWSQNQGLMREGGMALPPMPPWQNMAMGMAGLPMPGMGMPYMDAMNQQPDGDYKRRRY